MLGRLGFWVVAAALVATLMAAMHGVMGESLFGLLGGKEAGAKLFGTALAIFAVSAGLFWERERIQQWQKGEHNPIPIDWYAFAGVLVLFAVTMAAQGVLAFSTAHLVAGATHHAYSAMLVGGGIVFFGATLWLWHERDKLFEVKATVEPVERTKEPLHGVIAFLSTPGLGHKEEYEKDELAFEAATKQFETTLEQEGWNAALDALCGEGAAFGPVPRWNMQPPLRLLRALVNAPCVSDSDRQLVFVTTPKSEARWEKASTLLRRVAETMRKGPRLEICHIRELLNSDSDEAALFQPGAFDENRTLIQQGLAALERRGFDPSTLAVDATSATVEASVVGAIATINSRATFIYVNTNDHGVRRFDANATGAWATE